MAFTEWPGSWEQVVCHLSGIVIPTNSASGETWATLVSFYLSPKSRVQ